MAELARMRFTSATKPEENGVLVLNDDGTFQVKPSDEFREALAEIEEKAIHRSERYGTRLGFTLIALGAAAAAAGWLVGRLFGSIGSSISRPRSISDVEIQHQENGAFALRMGGVESKFQKITLSWNADEVVQAEADVFVEKFHDLRR